RRTLGRGAQPWRYVSPMGARARSAANQAFANTAPRAGARARSTADVALRDRDRDLAARPLFDLRAAHSLPAAARRDRYGTRCTRPRHRDPWCDRRLHRAIQGWLAGGPVRRADPPRAGGVRRAPGFPGSQGILVAAL